MSVIHILDDDAVNKIAAGEVVERPASVVKELIENSIDAGAKSVEVEIMAGGTSMMRVTDDGCGMAKDDAVMSVTRHATSKIRTAKDIESLRTLGFRGEALPTIAAVSRFSLLTRVASSEFGTELVISGGKQEDARDAGCRVGTTVRVEDLFFNTPARKKFLKTNQTEGARINECVVKQSFANPEVAFRLISNGRASLSTPGNGVLKDAIISVYGPGVASSLLPIAFSDEGLEIEGFITKPSMLRSSRVWQTAIVNGRVVESRAISRAIDNAYHSLLPKTGYPLAVVVIRVPMNTIDVNVHPRKTEIKFEDEGRIFRAVYKAVEDAVRPPGQTLEEVAGDGVNSSRRFSDAVDIGNVRLSENEPISREEVNRFFDAQRLIREERKNQAEAQSERLPGIEPDEKSEFDAPPRVKMIPIGQIARCYIVAKDADDLYLVDQHAAHERILYDKFAALADSIPAQELLVHAILSFSAQEARLIEANRELFFRLGFELDASGENEFRLRSVPQDIDVNEAGDVLRGILARLTRMEDPKAPDIRHACLAMTACKAAIKRGDELNLRQMAIVLDELAATSRPYTCPHGRPTILRFTSSELARMFKRT